MNTKPNNNGLVRCMTFKLNLHTQEGKEKKRKDDANKLAKQVCYTLWRDAQLLFIC